MRWASIQQTFRNGGMREVVSRAIRKVVRPAFRFGSLVFFDCDLRYPLPPSRPVAGIVAREAFVSDLPMFINPGKTDLRQIALERFSRGERCFVGIDVDTGRLANYRWATSIAGYL